jgi:hypothetical protein
MSTEARVVDPIRCGGCGGEVFKLAHVCRPDDGRVSGGGSFAGHVAITCAGCGAVSELRPEPAALRMDWADGNDKGVACGGWRAKREPGA